MNGRRDGVGHEHAAERDVRRADALGERDDVGADVVALGAEPVPEPAEAADHLVGDQEDAVLVADLADAAAVALRRRERAARVLDGLDEHRGDGLGRLLLDLRAQLVEEELRELGLGLALRAAVAVRVRHVPHARHERLERRAQRRDARERERAVRRAVVGDPARDHLVAVAEALELVELLHELDDRLVRLGASRDEEDAVQVARRQLGHLPCELDRARVGVVPVRVERQLGHLLGGRLAQLRTEAVADLGAEEPGERVEVLLAVRVVDRAVLAVRDDGDLVRLIRRLAREVHEEMTLRERLELGVVGHAWRSFRGVAARGSYRERALTASDRGRPLYSPGTASTAGV